MSTTSDADGLRPTEPRRFRTSENYRESDTTDVVFRSSDDVLFYIHRKNLEAHAGGFPPPEVETKGELVDLTESASTLENLFEYVYPQRHPDIELLSFEALYDLAEAAEKYEVFCVISLCKARMKHFVDDHPGSVFNNAHRHGYNDILSMVAPLLLDYELSEFVESFSRELLVPWIRYREKWTHEAFQVIYGIGRCTTCPSNSWKQTEASRICFELKERRSRAVIIDLVRRHVSPVEQCRICPKKYRRSTEGTIGDLEKAFDSLPLFHTFL